MAAHACLSVLAPGGRLIVYGGNDEGIRSAGGRLERVCREVETLATRGHGRVLAASRPADAPLRASLAAWRSVAPLTIAGIVRDWVSYPGVFAAGRVDEGTALLIEALPPLRSGDRVLDYGCGSGVIGAAALAAAAEHRPRPPGRRCRGAGGGAREHGRRASRPRHEARRRRLPRLRRHPVQSAAAQGHCRGPCVAGAAHRRRSGASAARRLPADRRAAARPAGETAGEAFGGRDDSSGEWALPRLAGTRISLSPFFTGRGLG